MRLCIESAHFFAILFRPNALFRLGQNDKAKRE